MGFTDSENYSSSMYAWNGRWLSLGELVNILPELWEKIAEEKGVSVRVLKNSIPRSITGRSGISSLIINDNDLSLTCKGENYSGSVSFIRRNTLSVKRSGTRFLVLDERGREVYSYYSFQSVYEQEISFGIYTYKLDGLPFRYAAFTDIDENTENTSGRSFHAYFVNDEKDILKFGHICTFVYDDDTKAELIHRLFHQHN